jgi:hypothetical protein
MVPPHSVLSRLRSLELACRHYCFRFSVQNSQKRHKAVASRYRYMSNTNNTELDKRQQNQGDCSAAWQSLTALITCMFLWHSAESGVWNERGQSQQKSEIVTNQGLSLVCKVHALSSAQRTAPNHRPDTLLILWYLLDT